MCHPRLTLAAAALLAATTPAPAVDYVWNVAANGNWNLNTNWAPTGVPGSADNATLGTLASGYTVSLTDTRAVNNLTINNSNATLAQSASLTVSSTGAFNMTAGTYGLSAGTLDVIGSLDFAVGTTFNWTGGSIGSSSNGPMLLGGLTLVTSSTGKGVFGTTLQNAGTVRWSAGAITPVSNPTALTNLSGALIDFRNDGTAFGFNGNAATIINRGTIRKSAGEASSTTVAWGVDFRGGGTVDAQIGVLNFSNGGTLNNGTTTFTNTGTLGGGTANLIGGTFNVPTGATFTAATANGVTLNWAGATLTAGTGGGAVAGVITVTGGGAVSGTTLQNAGTINWQAGGIAPATNPTALTNLGGASPGTIDFQADGIALAFNGNAATLVNQGILRKSGTTTSGTTVNWAVDFRGGGQVQANVGALNFNAGGTLSNGTTTFSSTGSGTASLTAGTFTVAVGDTFTAAPTGTATLRWAGATIGGGGTLAGTITVTGGGAVSGTTLQNAGTINWQAGGIAPATNPTALTNLGGASPGTIDFQADGIALAFNGNAATLVNQGILRKSAGTVAGTTVNWAVDFRGGGTVDAQLGALNFNAGGTLSNGTTTFTRTGTAVGGTANLTAGTFTVPAGATFTAATANNITLNWAGATIGGGGTVAGVITVTAGGGVSGTTLQNAGAINWLAGALVPATNPAALTNLPAGTINLQADGTAFGLNGNAVSLINQGTVQKSGGTVSNTAVNWAVTNSGTISGNVGTLAFNGGVINTGVVTVANGAAITGPITSNLNGVVRSSAASLVTDVATYGGPLAFNSGSTLQPGGVNTTGNLTVNGNLTTNSGSTMHIDLNGTTAGTGYDRVRVGTNVTTTLGGATLGGTTGASFNPSLSDQLFILVNDNANAIGGTFAGLTQNGAGTIGGWNFRISYIGNFATNALDGGNDIVLYSFTPVPEPGAVLAVAAAALGVGGFVRRRVRRVAAA